MNIRPHIDVTPEMVSKVLKEVRYLRDKYTFMQKAGQHAMVIYSGFSDEATTDMVFATGYICPDTLVMMPELLRDCAQAFEDIAHKLDIKSAVPEWTPTEKGKE